MANLTRTSLVAFTVVKLAMTIFVGLVFFQAEKTLMRAQDKSSRSFICARTTLRCAYIVATAMLVAAVLNNLFVVVRAI